MLIAKALGVLQIDTSLLVPTGNDVPPVGEILDGEIEVDPLTPGEIDNLADA